jgi:ribosomal protein S18 acetylase RimI-like enzyme
MSESQASAEQVSIPPKTSSSDPAKVYSIVEQNPTPHTYYELRKAAGLTPPPLGDIEKALAASWVSFIAIEGTPEAPASANLTSSAVGMGRLVGDGALFLEVVDVAIHPAHQRQGLGKRIMRALLDYADEHAPNAYISLIADMPGGPGLYSQLGFQMVAPSVGMYRCERVSGRKEAAKKALEEAQEQNK